MPIVASAAKTQIGEKCPSRHQQPSQTENHAKTRKDSMEDVSDYPLAHQARNPLHILRLGLLRFVHRGESYYVFNLYSIRPKQINSAEIRRGRGDIFNFGH